MTKYIKALIVIIAITSTAEAGMMGTGYQNGWKSYDKPQAGSVYGSKEVNSYGAGGGKNIANPWHVSN